MTRICFGVVRYEEPRYAFQSYKTVSRGTGNAGRGCSCIIIPETAGTRDSFHTMPAAQRPGILHRHLPMVAATSTPEHAITVNAMKKEETSAMKPARKGMKLIPP
jgi:hypothetical protein